MTLTPKKILREYHFYRIRKYQGTFCILGTFLEYNQALPRFFAILTWSTRLAHINPIMESDRCQSQEIKLSGQV
jgi:hypothetical protein